MTMKSILLLLFIAVMSAYDCPAQIQLTEAADPATDQEIFARLIIQRLRPVSYQMARRSARHMERIQTISPSPNDINRERSASPEAIAAGGDPKPYITPEQFGAIGKNKTGAQMGWDQEKMTRRFPETGATPQDQIDWAAWQRAFIVSDRTGKPIMNAGKDYYFNKPLRYDNLYVTIACSRPNMWLVGAGPLVARAVLPTSSLQAEEFHTKSSLRMTGLNIQCTNGQTALDFNSIGGLIAQHINIYSAGTGIKNDFCLKSNVSYNHFESCGNGLMLGLAIPGNREMSSNVSRMIQNSCHSCRDTAFANKYAYETDWQQTIAEGSVPMKIGFYVTFENKTTAKNITTNTFHFEATQGVCDAYIKLDLRDQKIYLDNIISHYQGILIDAKSCCGGGVYIGRLAWFVPSTQSGEVGKTFRSNNTTWRFDWCEGFSSASTIAFATNKGGVVPDYGVRSAEGYNSFLIVNSWDQ